MRVAIIGAGAAGCFCAIHLRAMCPDVQVDVYEGGRRALAKVAVTGGGRCNLTNSFAQVSSLGQVYPRGEHLMKRALAVYDHQATMQWFRQAGVQLVTQEDECVFPQSQDAMEIVNTLLQQMRTHRVTLHLSHRLCGLRQRQGGGYVMSFTEKAERDADVVIVTTGGSPRSEGLRMYEALGLKTVEPHPSLFSFNIEGDWKQELMGAVVQDVQVSLAGTRFRAQGPLLLTHWGMSGPAVLRLSSYAAVHLAEAGYRGTLVVNWTGGCNEDEARRQLQQLQCDNAQKQVLSAYPRYLTARHWAVLLRRCGIEGDTRWRDVGRKQLNRMVTILTGDNYAITGKCRCREEFVTCGGISLRSVNPSTQESRTCPGLYFAGEVLDVDAVTGGFNLQAAWSMAYVVAQSVARSHSEA